MYGRPSSAVAELLLLRLRIHFIFRRQRPLSFLLNFHELINSVTIVRQMTYVLNVGLHSTNNDLQILRSLKVIDYIILR